MTELVFGNVVKPPVVRRIIPDAENGAWDDLGKRTPVGMVRHTMVGTLGGTDGWFRRGSASNGLTDYGVGGIADGALDGTIYEWNDPSGAASAGVSANRAPWANGNVQGLEGDGPAFIRTRGVNAVNRDLIAVERSDGGQPDSCPVSDKQFAAIVGIQSYHYDAMGMRWDTFPVHPTLQIVTDFEHFEFTDKAGNSAGECPGLVMRSMTDRFQDTIRGRLKAGQTHTEGAPAIPPETPIENPGHAWPNGWTTATLRERFGRLPHTLPNGKIVGEAFNEKGPISNAWVGRGVQEKITRLGDLPKPLAWHDLTADADQAPSIVIFDGPPSSAWVLYRPHPGIAWRWMP